MFGRKQMLMSAIVVMLMIASPSSFAQRGGGWTYLGEANVDGKSDHDNIKVGSGQGSFRALQFGVERAPITFASVVVHYNNGADDKLPLQGRVPAGGRSHSIDLRGGNREIRSVEVWYAKGNWNGPNKPKLRLYGRH